jgi:hypothetical protein
MSRTAKLATNRTIASGGGGGRHRHYPRDAWQIQSTSVRHHQSRRRGSRLWVGRPQPAWTQRAQIEPAYHHRHLLPSPPPAATPVDAPEHRCLPPLLPESQNLGRRRPKPPEARGGPLPHHRAPRCRWRRRKEVRWWPPVRPDGERMG